ncbi:hypothetical protein [Endozoicomonas sp. ALD040]|uniref:hypothetical protein n=1 Tax=unclassified Endozoicomonas TaxID=2644528 RepID=UPI003BB1D60D
MKNYLFVIMLGYTSVFSSTARSNDVCVVPRSYDQKPMLSGLYDEENSNDDYVVPHSHNREPMLWGLYDEISLRRTLLALHAMGLVVYWVIPRACLGAAGGYYFFSGSPHIRALKGAAILGGLSACAFSTAAGVMLYNCRIDNVKEGSH